MPDMGIIQEVAKVHIQMVESQWCKLQPHQNLKFKNTITITNIKFQLEAQL